MARAQAVFAQAEADTSLTASHLAYLAMARAYLDRQMFNEAKRCWRGRPADATQDALELAILHKRSGQLEAAHQIFAAAYPDLQNNAKAVHEFARPSWIWRQSAVGPPCREHAEAVVPRSPGTPAPRRATGRQPGADGVGVV